MNERGTRSVNVWLLVGAVNGFLAVVAGAFAAHGLETKVDARMLSVFQTGAHYHLTHALAIVAASLVGGAAARRARLAAALFTAGAVCFSGSLYVLVLTGATAVALVTPVGGTLFLAGWAVLAWAAFASEK